jgi:trk system potassium uptake protein TrkA
MPREFCVIGLGRFGTAVATTLFELGHSVLGVDKDMARVNHVAPFITHAVQADATEEESLRSLGIRNFDTVVVSLGPELEPSILVTVLLKELGVRSVVAKARSPFHGKVLERVGADRVVYPEREMGIRVAHRLASRNILDVIELSDDMSVLEAAAPRAFWGRSLKDLALRHRYGVTVLALKRGQELLSLIGGETRVQDGDVLVLVGAKPDLARFEQVLEEGDEER